MFLFHELQDGVAILVSRGVYKQCKLFYRKDELYAAWGGGFIRLYKDGTGIPNVKLEGVSLPTGLSVAYGDFGKAHLVGDGFIDPKAITSDDKILQITHKEK